MAPCGLAKGHSRRGRRSGRAVARCRRGTTLGCAQAAQQHVELGLRGTRLLDRDGDRHSGRAAARGGVPEVATRSNRCRSSGGAATVQPEREAPGARVAVGKAGRARGGGRAVARNRSSARAV